jgi:hypothetical protein
MTDPLPCTDLNPYAQAMDRFVRTLRGRADLARLARLESVFAAPDAAVFDLDRTLARLWPSDLAALPKHEVIWARREGQPPHLTLAAFDSAGRVLLRQSHEALDWKRPRG